MKKGFSLLETLVAISILSLALAGILSLFSISVRASSGAGSQIKAFFLASEAMEYVRNKRDSNIIAGQNWSAALGACSNGCYIDVFNSVADIVPCPGTCPRLRFNSALNRYDYDPAGQETIFTRKITTEQVNANEIKLMSEISWAQVGGERSFLLEEHLFDLSF